MGRNLRFRAPVGPGDTVTATVTVEELNVEKRRATRSTVFAVDGEAVALEPAAS